MSVAAEVGKGREVAQLVSSTSRLMGKHDITMDQEARDLGTSAIARVESHEQVCAERWRGAAAATIRLETAVTELKKAVEDRIGKVPATIIAGLTGIIGFLAARAFPMH